MGGAGAGARSEVRLEDGRPIIAGSRRLVRPGASPAQGRGAAASSTSRQTASPASGSPSRSLSRRSLLIKGEKTLKPRTAAQRAADKASDQQWQQFINGIEACTIAIEVGGYKAQLAAALAIKDYVAERMAEGIGPELSAFTKAILGVERPPLAGLARHLIVRRPAPIRGANGRFTGTYDPAEVTFDTEEHSKAAESLEKGGFIDLSAKEGKDRDRRIRLIIRAKDAGLEIPRGSDTGGVWLWEPRPFSHLFNDDEAEQRMQAAVNCITSGGTLKRHKLNVPESKFDPGVYQPTEGVNFDDVAAVMADPFTVGALDDAIDAQRGLSGLPGFMS